MTEPGLAVNVRMYNVGFGDAFVVTVRTNTRSWRMIIDCGVHPSGQARPLADSVKAILSDLSADSHGTPPQVDVIVATHHHADHIAGFAFDAWQELEVGEVWVPFVEDLTDKDAKALRAVQQKVTTRLHGLIAQSAHGREISAWPDALLSARWFVENSSRNDKATNRLLGKNKLGFARPHNVRFLPSTRPSENIIETGIDNVQVHVLGPSRDPAFLKHMNPPAHAGWLTLLDDEDSDTPAGFPLFPQAFIMDDVELHRDFSNLSDQHQALKQLDQLDDAGLLAAASILEQSVNNTSVFLVLDVGGLHFVFPGDSQQGAWDHVLGDPETKALISSAAFYKIAHHGSANGTPKRYITDDLVDGAYAMLPWGLVKRWKDTIPKAELLETMKAHGHHVIRADHPVAEPDRVTVHDDLWSEVQFIVKSPTGP